MSSNTEVPEVPADQSAEDATQSAPPTDGTNTPLPRPSDSAAVEDPPPALSVLEENIHSAKTPGEKFFPSFAVTEGLEEKANERIAQYPDDQKRCQVNKQIIFRDDLGVVLEPWRHQQSHCFFMFF